MLQNISEAATFISNQIRSKPKVGIILGTGLGGLTCEIDIHDKIPYRLIPHFPVSTVEGHDGMFISGTMGNKEVIALQGRTHFYEGGGMERITFPVRVLKMLGIDLLILSNASGGINPSFRIGDIMIVTDHINLMSTNPLISKDQFDPDPGDRHIDMSHPYDPGIIQKAMAVANRYRIEFQTGTLAAVTGPCFETPAEYRYIRTVGADAVGMSIIPEVLVARQLHITCLAISVITDLGVKGKIMEVTHKDVLESASSAEPKMTLLLRKLLEVL
jgi:purine-nucleoside phosphorylase